MASGVGAPGAIAAKLGNMGFKGKKVTAKIEKVIRLGVGDTKGKTFGRGQIARMALPGEAQAAEAGEEDEMCSSEDPNDPSVFSSKSLYNLGVA